MDLTAGDAVFTERSHELHVHLRRHSQALDHAFVTDNLVDRSELDIVHVNVDLPHRVDNATASDREPLLTRVRLE